MSVVFVRSPNGYGWTLTLSRQGRQRLRYHSTNGTTRMWPRLVSGADEHCNRALTATCWPLGMVDVWWEPRRTWRTHGRCAACMVECAEWGVCVDCGCRPCDCSWNLAA